MNVNSGGPHLLLFERDQQLTALLSSEFQLAGYECHAARTAVEVFDAIARYPIRLVLVNLAQPAAGRREFWVALDAQRRGRGVQVFTFRCINLAGYGADDPDDRGRTVLADIEVNGMTGVMNLVDAVRARIPGSTTGGMSRISPAPVASRQGGTRETASAPQAVVAPPASITGQITSPLPMVASNGSSVPSVPSPAPARQQPAVSTSSMPAPPAVTPSAPPTPSAPASSALPAGSASTTPGFTDKIRAIIYPSSRNFSPMPAGQEIGGGQINAQNPQSQPPAISAGDESGLEQLSRMLREQDAPAQEEEARRRQQAQLRGTQASQPPTDSPPISAGSLRASPIQDIAIERVADGLDAGEMSRQIRSREAQPTQQPQYPDIPPRTNPTQFVPPSTPALPPTPVPSPEPPVMPASTAGGSAMTMPPPTPTSRSAAAPTSLSAPTPLPTPISTPAPTPTEPAHEDVEQDKGASSSSFTEDKPRNTVAGESALTRSLVEQVQASVQGAMRRNDALPNAASDDTLLDIVQSLPPMPSPSQQTQPPVLSGRATRSLGSVLLEGHLVPKHRLEVAQHIQRMLRGVDMNYQLGEILLMFKLLTPDQLLAASLVSYGLISTVQISALGRIRQELHSIGLEYDLESLLVLFRILSPEQLREVRASWSG